MTQQLPNGSRWSRCLCGPKAAVVMLTLLCSAPAVWAYDCEVDGIYYNLNAEEQTASVTRRSVNTKYTGAVAIPEEIAYGDVIYSVATIDNRAFDSCRELTSVSIPNSVTEIGNYAFYGCSGLTSLTIPNSVTTIGDHAFYRCRGLTTVTIGNSVTTIGEYAFYDCSSLTEVTIPEGVTTIESNTFRDCSSLTAVTIPNSVAAIGQFAFYGCSSLTEVTIPEGITTIEQETFRSCSSLMEVTIPNSVTRIDSYAFYGCSGLTEVTIPNSVTSIGTSTFYRCSSLTEVTIPENVTTIGNAAFYGCSSLKMVAIPNSVTTIGEWAFSDCISLTEVSIPNSVTTIGSYTFENCSSLTTVSIGKSVTTIGERAFFGCSSLMEVIIPNSVETIDERAFLYCRSLQKIYCLNPEPPKVVNSGSPFDDDTYRRVPLYVPAKSVELYAATDPWSRFATIEAIAVEEPTLYVLTYLIDGEVYRTDTLAYGDSIVAPEVEAPEGYRFSGWSEIPETMPAEDITVEGSFIQKVFTAEGYKYALVKDETHMSGDIVLLQHEGETIATLTYGVEGGADFKAAKSDSRVSGFTAYTEGNGENGSDTSGTVYYIEPAIDAEITVGVILNADKAFYVKEDGVALADYDGIKVAEKYYGTYTFRVRAGKTYAVYCTGSKLGFYGFSVAPLYALTYYVDGEVYQSDTLTAGTAITPAEEPTKEGYTFSGWEGLPATMPAEDVTVEGSFTVNYYALTYYVDGEVYQTDSVAYGTEITPAEEPAKEGYTFSGWSEIPETMPAEDVTVEGSFSVNTYTLTWMVNNTVFLTQNLKYGTPIVAPEAPEVNGYDFDGWIDVPETMPAHDLIIYSSYTLGIDGVTADGAIPSGPIYTLEGLKVGTTDINALPAGTYIVGGKKVMKQ